MSRLDFNIRRLEAQRDNLNLAIELVRDVPGAIFELGLGNGRTYHHLRERLPEREIFAFERDVAAHPDCIPDAAHLMIGDMRQTLPQAAKRFAGTVALVHADFGAADADRDSDTARLIAEFLPVLLAPGGLLAADRDLAFTGAAAVPGPPQAEAGVYFLYRHDGAARATRVAKGGAPPRR